MSESNDPSRMTPDQLRQAGSLLYGQSWQTDFARAIDIDPRRVRQWLTGDRPIPLNLWEEVVKLLQEKSKDTAALADELNRQFLLFEKSHSR
ncbi:transcriptional regulator [Acinetobacter sp. ACIN00229]|uniref:transcriptional regulator n=1 Tax=Acinetobacter sp. ACIN00229 TaxID=2792607 RepID=UPI0018E011CE|nr:transcriptional regulator [Acinetobacter sp. ACIN00229]MBI0422094.1 transcriptional regulator [Acinetobacter sp. ACIN00229]